MNEKVPCGESKENHARIGNLLPLFNFTIIERRKGDAPLSHNTLAIFNWLSAAIAACAFLGLNRQLEIYSPSKLASNTNSFLNTYTPISKSFLDRMDSASPIIIFAIFWIAALIFSMTLITWFFTNGSLGRKRPNKFLGSAFVLVALMLEIWAGVTLEEFCLVAMPMTTSTGLIFASILRPW